VPYLSQADAEAAVSKILWCWSDDDGEYDSDRLLTDLESIDGEVNGFLAPRYEVPVTEPIAVNVLRGYEITLLRQRGYSRHPTAETPQSVLAEASQTRGALRDISAGRQLLGDAPQRTAGVRVTSLGKVAGNAAQMTATKLGAWG
jgi:hypothetical protein